MSYISFACIADGCDNERVSGSTLCRPHLSLRLALALLVATCVIIVVLNIARKSKSKSVSAVGWCVDAQVRKSQDEHRTPRGLVTPIDGINAPCRTIWLN